MEGGVNNMQYGLFEDAQPSDMRNPEKRQADVSSRLLSLHKKVFVYDSSEADERFFRNRIVDYLNGKAEDTLTQTMWYAVWERNDGGKTLMYCYFNEYRQRVYFDKSFWEWAKLMCQKISEELAMLGGL